MIDWKQLTPSTNTIMRDFLTTFGLPASGFPSVCDDIYTHKDSD